MGKASRAALPYGRTLRAIHLCANEPIVRLGYRSRSAVPGVARDFSVCAPTYGPAVRWGRSVAFRRLMMSPPNKPRSMNAFRAVNLCATKTPAGAPVLQRSRYGFEYRQP
jgi:hypothetical protein